MPMIPIEWKEKPKNMCMSKNFYPIVDDGYLQLITMIKISEYQRVKYKIF